MYDITSFQPRRHRGFPRIYDAPSPFDLASFRGGFGALGSFDSWNNTWDTQSFDSPNNIEQATRQHVAAQKDMEKAKEKYEEAKKKFEECEKKVQEAERALSLAKQGASQW